MSSSHSSIRSSCRTSRRSASGPARRASGVIRLLGILLAAPLLALLALSLLPTAALAQGASGTPAAVSISPDSGPVGARLTVSGEHFKAGDPVEVGYTTSACSTMTTIAGATGAASSDGSLSVVVTWPLTGPGSFIVCVHDKTTGKSYPSDTPYVVLSAAPPALTVNPSPATSQVQVTINGANFLPAGGSVEVLWGPQSAGGAARGDMCANSIKKVTSDSAGKFTVTFQAPFAASDLPIAVIAVSPQGSCGGSPVLSAQRNLTVKAVAVATATGSTSPNPVAPTWPPTGIWSVVYCLVGLLLFLLLLLALLVASRNRNKNQPAVVQQQGGQANQYGQGGARLMGSTRVTVGPDGRPIASEQTYAQPRRGAPVQVADTAEDMPQLQGPGGAPPPRYTPRYGPPQR